MPQEVGAGMAAVDPEAKKKAEQERAVRLDALGESLAKKRSEAIEAREQSGIEQQWLEDEEFYQGIDDANRNEHSNAWRTKPPGQAVVEPKSATRSTVFVNITAPYCDIAAARFADMVLPSDEANFKFDPTPIPELIALSKGELPPMLAKQVSEEPNAQAQVDEAVKQAKVMVDTARAKAEKAQKRVEDWHIEGQWHAETRRVLEDSARIGSGVLKGPVPVKRKAIAFIGGQVVIEEKVHPASKRVDVWNFYPDGACGDNIHNGAYTWERDYLTPKQLQELIGAPDYIESQIRLCLEEGPQKALAQVKKEPDRQPEGKESKRFEIWYFHGTAEREDMLAAGCVCDEKYLSIPAMLTMVNNRVIKAALNPLDSGDFP